jgi:hypothetical protein
VQHTIPGAEFKGGGKEKKTILGVEFKGRRKREENKE